MEAPVKMDEVANGDRTASSPVPESAVKDELSPETISSATPVEPVEEADSTELGVKETAGAASPSDLTKKDEDRFETVKCAEQDVPNTAQTEQPTTTHSPEKDSTGRMIDAAENRSMEVEEQSTVPSSADTSVSVREPQVADDRKLESEAVQNIKATALSLLCQYSGSSSDSEPESAGASTVAGDKKPASSSSSADDESDDESVKAVDDPLSRDYRDHDSSILVSDAETMDTNAVSSDDDEDDGRTVSRVPLRTKGEVLPHELPPIEELTITVPEAECKLIGRVDSIVSQIVLVQSLHGVELLNLDTVLFLERGARPLGKIFDVIGQVSSPLYCVLFNSNQEVIAKNVTVGMEVYCAPRTEHTSFIILSELMRSKGSDASWRDDNEPPASLCEYSDDEAERSVRKGRKKYQRAEPSSNGAPSSLQQPYLYHQQQQPPPQHQSRAPHFRSSAPNNRRNYYPRHQPSGHSWHHNFNTPRNQYPHHWPQQPRHPYPQQQQQQQQYPQAGPQGSSMLPNPFATLRPPHPPPGHGQ